MSIIVPRTCTEISAGDADQHREKKSPLKSFRDVPAYVLLGDPGAGKTTAFEAECGALGEQACLITARDFLTFDPQSRPEWRGKTLFIDGLDEIRVGADDARTPFDQIRGRLDELGKPHFRLSCREADWLGANDRRHLESVSPDSKVTVLRLNPLTDSDISDILNDRSDIGDAQVFMAAAKDRGVEGLLTNPQTLKMLADVVAQGGGWPKSRKETFEMACGQMVREHNEEHEAAQESNSPLASDQLLGAAGRLCAVQLISGKAGFTLRGQADEGYPDLDQYGYDSPEMLRHALATKLFRGVSNNRFAPVHRHIAEFLGARHLAKVIKSGLPAQRVIALIAGKNGTVVTEMRGLSAWLAAHCKDARTDLIRRDPIGVGLYGDIREFYADEKHALLEFLNHEASRLDSARRMAAAFGALATPDMEPVLKAILTDSSREKEHQLFTDFVLRVLRKGGPLPNLSELLLEIIRDDTWWSHVNYAALNAFIHNCPDSGDKTSKLKALLADIRTGSLSDPDDELLGTLLARLYPHDLPPSEVWDYLSETRNQELFFGMYWGFLRLGLLQKSSDDQVAELLDSLNERLSGLRPALESSRPLEHLPMKLLAHGLKAHGDELDTERLYNWLDVGFAGNPNGFLSSDEEGIQEIRLWLEQRPEVQKAVFMEGLARCPESDEFSGHVSNVRKHLYGADRPADFGLWCLKQAVAMADTKPHVAELLLVWAVQAHTDPSINKDLSLDVLKEHTRKNERLNSRLTKLLSPPSIPPTPPELPENRKKYTEERKQQEEQWLEYVLSNETALRENQAAPDLLYKMAEVYFGHFFRLDGDAGLKAIEKKLRGNCDLIDAMLQGLRGTVDREDVPGVKEILSDREKGNMYYIGLPFLAGLAELERTAPEKDPPQWDDGRIRKALAFYYCEPHMDYRPKWYQRLLAARPEIVAKVQEQFAICEFRIGREHIYKLAELAHDKAHAQVARYASLPLLRAFPTRCKQKQIEDLDHLLWAAIQYADRTSLRKLINRKLSWKSMNDAQRVHWLAAGIIVSPKTYNDLLRDFVQDREGRILHLTAFFCSQISALLSSFSESRIAYELRIPGLELLVRLVGNYVGPDLLNADGQITPAMQASSLVNDLIQRLAASPAKEASDALDRLLVEPALSSWRDVLSRAQDAQRVTWRDAVYHHFTIEQVCQTLNDGTPANAADLSALVMDRLRELADQIRRGNTDDWSQYWNEPHGQPPTPKREDRCQKALLSDLRQRLPQEVDAQPEGQYANDKRADIRVSYGDFQVPVEIKRNRHRDLWSAPRNQLIKLYTSAPDTDGYGIYLVFWFGKDRTPSPPSGTRPANAEELKERLEATLSPDEAHKISICVIDVSRPCRPTKRAKSRSA